MKHLSLILFTSFLALFSINSTAQTGLGFAQAQITKKNSDTLKVLIEIKENYTDVVNYKTTPKGSISSIPVTDVLSMKTNFNTEYENLVIDGAERILLKMASGKANMYAYVEYGATASVEVLVRKQKAGDATHNSRKVAYLIIRQDATIVLTEDDFKEKLTGFVSDCPKVSSKVNKATFDKIVEVVNLYNKCD